MRIGEINWPSAPAPVLPEKLKRLANAVYGTWTVFNFTWLMLLNLPFIVLPIILHEYWGSHLAYRVFMKFWGFTFSALSGVFYRAQGLEQLREGQAYIFVANHNSFLDSPALVHTIPSPFKALGKKEILSYPVFGFIFRYIGVTVDRNSLQSRRKSYQVIRQKLAQGFHVLIFPEGTMNDGRRLLTPFYDGAFKLALETQTPIVPVAIHNSRHILPKGSWKLRPGTITVQFGAPIAVNDRSSDELKAQSYEAIKTMLEQGGAAQAR